MAVKAPRILKAPIGCRCSHFRKRGRPATSTIGVRTATPARARWAARIASRVTGDATAGGWLTGRTYRPQESLASSLLHLGGGILTLGTLLIFLHHSRHVDHCVAGIEV